MQTLNESFEVHDELNPKLWDGFNLKPEVHDKIIEIVNEFEDYCQIDFEIIDVQLVGSNASYNYTNQSDVDIHIITDFDDINPSEELVQVVFNLQKNNFNKKYDISLHGVEAEVYVEDVNANLVSNGMYSVLSNKWIKKPNKIEPPEDIDISNLLNTWNTIVSELCTTGTIEEIKQALDNLKLIRKNSLAIDGEYGKGNQLFKELRNNGSIGKLKDRKDELTSDKLTLEGLQK